jgi:ACS family hexuronate transporter-like MFS transporter
MNGVSGIVIDKLGTRVGYALVMLWWTFSTMLQAFGRGAMSFAACRFMVGVGSAGNWPAGVKVSSEWFPPKERALAGGIFNSGSAIGALVAGPLAAIMVLHFGVSMAFVVVGAGGLLWVAAWLLIYRQPPRELAPEGGAGKRSIPVLKIIRTRFVITFILMCMCMEPCWFFYIFWTPKFLTEAHGVTLLDLATIVWIPFLSADIGNIVGGAFTGLLIRRGMPVPKARKVGTVVFSLLMLGAVPAVFAGSPLMAIAFISVATFGYTGYGANSIPFTADVFPQRMVASAYGLVSMGSGIGGAIFGGVTGWLVANYGYKPAFMVFAILPLVAIALCVFMMGPLVPDKRFADEEPGKA